ncbi:MAG: ATP-binding cassette domain-containing protein, partial [Cyclobacteriaceae bacterium]|nr:ATP-binding cassette domain-containing protein [Cyclobacteriaceae bacterium]
EGVRFRPSIFAIRKYKQISHYFMLLLISQGQAQRVAIARAIINKPSLILADEPTSALDDKNCEQVIDLLTKLATENNAALIVATHDHRLKSRLTKQIIL